MPKKENPMKYIFIACLVFGILYLGFKKTERVVSYNPNYV